MGHPPEWGTRLNGAPDGMGHPARMERSILNESELEKRPGDRASFVWNQIFLRGV